MIVLERRWSDFSTRRYQIVSSCSVLVDAPIEATSTVESGGPEAVQRVQRGRVIKNHRRRREKWDLGGSPLRTVHRHLVTSMIGALDVRAVLEVARAKTCQDSREPYCCIRGEGRRLYLPS